VPAGARPQDELRIGAEGDVEGGRRDAMTGLVADIGGTNARFALCDDGGALQHVLHLPTAGHPQIEDAIADYIARIAPPTAGGIDGACLAVAGPVADGRASLTNAHWQFDEASLARVLGYPVRLVNDFQAQAAALGVLGEGDVELIGDVRPGSGSRFVLGPGTGLGGAAWLPDGAWGRVVPTEIGHVDIAPGDALEVELLNVLSARFPRVTWEHVLCGGGLVNLHAAMAQLWGADPAPLLALSPAEVVARALEAQDPVAMHTLEVFANWLGGLAGNLALTFLPRGGVFLTGGIAGRLAGVLAGGGFRRRFEDRAPLGALLRGIATARIRDLDHGLRGAAVLLRAG
jgi:glucokinase